MNAKLACVGMLGLMLACARSSGAQEPPPPPSFPSEANVITVDAVVLDEDGAPVRGLAKDDFAVYEEGRRQEVVVFETRETATAPPSPSVPQTVASSRPDDGGPSRVFALLIDDLGLTPPVASNLRPALADWIREKAHPRDEITIMTTSGDQWWTDTVERGREAGPKPSTPRPLPPSLLAGSARGGIPLRMSAGIQDNNGAGLAHVQLVIEIDNGRVPVDTSTTPWQATLDLTVLVAGLDRPPEIPIDQRMHLTLAPGEVGTGWWLVSRDLWLPPGVSQVRVSLRDIAGKAHGVVTQRLVVPDVDQPYLSTPVLTDRTVPPEGPGDPPRLVPTANRRFGERGPLYCQYEVFTFGGQSLPGVPRLRASHVLQTLDGRVVASEAATPIENDGFKAVRRIVLPTDDLADGAYVLHVSVEDSLAERTLQDSVSFVIEREDAMEGADVG